MNKFKKISLLFSLVIAFVLGFSFLNVDAEGENNNGGQLIESSEACKNLFDSNGNVNLTAVSDKYQPKVTVAGTKRWKVSINPTDTNDSSVLKKLRDVQFKLVRINTTEITDGRYVSFDHPLTLDEQLQDGYMTMRFRVDMEHPDPDCKSEKVEFEVEIEVGQKIPDYDEGLPPVEIESSGGQLNEINCGAPSPGFQTEFCKAKGAATSNASLNFTNQFNGNNTVKKYKDVKGANTYSKFICDNTTIYGPRSDDNYYTPTNVGYLYGSGTYKLNNGNYIYHYDPCSPTTGAAITCEVTCEEAVTVEYGAPVASKAGLCFEYKVKVTSRVLCNMTKEPPLPSTVTTVCTPTPTCTGIGRSGTRYYLTEGGPSEDFDRCINACDGGKYTSKCSKKCYKEVYQDTLISYKAPKTASCCTHCYTNGGTRWRGGGPGRYYGGSCKSEYVPDSNGICRHDYGNGNICQDDCWWNGCPDGVYLNPGYSGPDYQANIEKYNAAVRNCKAAASCSTSQAEFTITVDYKDDTNTVRTINFPYNKNLTEINPEENAFSKDKACSRGASGCTSTSTANNTALLGLAGCYDHSSSEERVYYAEWGFPGSWINKKTGELSYLDKSGTSGWQTIQDKFCLPFNAQNMNESWWRYYYVSQGKSFPTGCDNRNIVEDYNIRAKTKDFGYFGWNIAIDCFYAVGDDKCGPTPTPEPGLDYVIRSVDLEDLFPNTDGTPLNDSDDIGRTPGFNWSDKANNEKNDNYKSYPLVYAKYIQDEGYSIYSDTHLDYEFYLSPAVLKELRGKRTDYTLFNGMNITDSNGVIRYKSDLFRGTGIAAGNGVAKKVPEERLIVCNNINNGSCQ